MSVPVIVTLILCGVVVWLLLPAFIQPSKAYELPFLAGVMTLTFVLPQLPGILADPFMDPADYTRTIVITILAVAMMRLGWLRNARPITIFKQVYDEGRLLKIAAILSLFGSIFYYKLSQLPGDVKVGVEISGVQVIYLFFAEFLTYGLAISLLCLARRPSLLSMLIVGYDLLFYLQRIVVTGKRAETAELALMILLAFWFHRRWAPSRWMLVAGLVAAMIGMSSIAQYRNITRANSGPVWGKIAKIDVTADFENQLESGGPEMRNAIHRIGYISRQLRFDYGAIHWNRLVQEFVPSQIVGTEFKEALKLPMPPEDRDYNPLTGTTETGMADAFGSFWYFGVLEFFLLAYVMARLWATANAGWTTGQIVYTLSAIPAIHAISHLTDWVVDTWVQMLLFLAPVLLFAVTVRRDRRRGPTPVEITASDTPPAPAE